MTYEEFLYFVKGYDEFNEYVNNLYNLGMVTDDCPIMEMYGYYAKAICKNFDADYVWFLNWADDKCLHVEDWDGTHGDVDYWIRGTEEMYKFLQSETAREECWI